MCHNVITFSYVICKLQFQLSRFSSCVAHFLHSTSSTVISRGLAETVSGPKPKKLTFSEMIQNCLKAEYG